MDSNTTGIVFTILDKAITIADIIQVFICIILATTVVVAYEQLKQLRIQLKINYELERKKFTLLELSKTREPIAASLKALDFVFNFSHRAKSNPITKNDIHEAICEKDDKKFVADEAHSCLALSSAGHGIKQNIITVLETYEYIAAGVNSAMFDENIVLRLMKNPLIRTYEIFQPYIKHLRDDHDRPNAFKELEEFYKKITETKPTADKPLV